MTLDLYSKIASTVPTLQGWCSLQKAYTLASIIIAHRPKTVVEVGVFAGRSLIPMAMACKSIGHGTVIGIDPFSPAESTKNEVPENADWWGKIDHNQIHNEFISKVNELGLNNVVQFYRKRSDDVEPPNGIGLFHCDGSHTDQAITDMERYAPKVSKGGIVVADDITWVGGGVRRAVDVLLESGFVQLYHVQSAATDNDMANDWAVFQRV